MGVLRNVRKPTYEEQLDKQIQEATAKKGKGKKDKGPPRDDGQVRDEGQCEGACLEAVQSGRAVPSTGNGCKTSSAAVR